jgi:hypothetical protein
VTLTLHCPAGLANRLRVLVSGAAMAHVTGRSLIMHWPRTTDCAAAFRELFAGDWPVVDVDEADPMLAERDVRRWSHADVRRLLSDRRPHVALSLNAWLVRPGDRTLPHVTSRYGAALDALTPVAALATRVADFKATHFRPFMIGVHLRRGDFTRTRVDVAGNTPEAMAAVDRLLATAPDAGIFLSTDDGAVDATMGRPTPREGTLAAFRARYGSRVVSARPRSLDRRTTEGVQDAVVDLWLLRSTSAVVGTGGSSFSELAVTARPIPRVFVSGGLPAYRSLAWIERSPRAHELLLRAFRFASAVRHTGSSVVARLAAGLPSRW